MINKITLFAALFLLNSCGGSKSAGSKAVIDKADVTRIVKTLSSDEMEGRATFTPGLEKAAKFIESEFQTIGLMPFNGAKDFRQTFYLKPRGGKDSLLTQNLIGVIPGKSKPNEYVIFSGHYDHLGNHLPTVAGDTIANGADDDASGVTAMITLAKYYKALGTNERTLIFVAFTGEEIGLKGSSYFSKQMNPADVVAMFNIEMIGKKSKFGLKTMFMTGYELTDMGAIIKKNLEGSGFKIEADPYLEMGLFYRSDNASLAKQGVPAHTISTDDIKNDQLYHTVSDSFESLDMENMYQTIQAIAVGARSIVDGKDTPTRVKSEKLKK
jgi:Zn-dependent M28 family amino/carboxypeptidase